MSEMVVSELSSFKNYKYDGLTKRIINLKTPVDADLDEFLAIAHILDENYIKYKFTTNVDIRIIGKK
jgi:hypothetical protein